MHRAAAQHPPVGQRPARRPMPSPATSNSVSPTKRANKILSRESIHASPVSDEEDELVSGDEADPANRTKLEQKREKNRIKQRNLRLRRQNHINELEGANSALQNEINVLRNTIASLQHRENNLNAWVRDLESALFAHGLSNDVNHLRRMWSAHTDPLATLANAAAVTTFGGGAPGFAALPSRRSSAASTSHSAIDGVPYPTPTLPWDQQMPPAWGGPGFDDRKRKRDSFEFVPPLPAPEPPHAHRHDTLPPIHPDGPAAHRPALPPFPQYPAGPAERSTSAPQMPPIPARPGSSSSSRTRSIPAPLEAPTSRRGSETSAPVSPHHLRIADLLSPARDDPTWIEPRSSFDSQAELDIASERRWSAGELSVIDSSLSAELSAQMDQALSQVTRSAAGLDATFAQTSASYTINPYPTLPVAFTQGVHHTFPAITYRHQALDPPLLPAPPVPLDVNIPRLDLHPAILACRSLLLSLLPNPLPYPLPPLPPLEPAHQKLLLLALTALVPQAEQPMFHQRQLKFIPAEDAKRLLQYQADPESDARLVLFPIAIMRAKAVQALMAGRDMDITAFVNDTLASARIFGATLDPDAWEMGHDYWQVWQSWIPRGREYCHSLSKWRRRDGHSGATVVEMILGMEAKHSRRTDPVGKPLNWTF